jgi:hypothetical protein
MEHPRRGWTGTAAGVTAIAAGSTWALAAWRWYAEGATGHGRLDAGDPEALFAAALVLMSVAIGTLGKRARGGWTRIGAVVAVAGALLAALGNVVLSCDPRILAFLGRRQIDCGPAGGVVSGCGRLLLDGGLGVLAIAVARGRRLASASPLPLLIVATSVATPLVGEITSRAGGSALARAGELGARLAHGAAWTALGWALLSGKDGGEGA